MPYSPITDERIVEIALQTRLYRFQPTAGDPIVYEISEQQLLAFARALLLQSSAQSLEAMKAAVPWLSLLGDFIGNGVSVDKHNHGTPLGDMGRCDAMLKLRDAIDSLEASAV
jgi:hypothetical protein